MVICKCVVLDFMKTEYRANCLEPHLHKYTKGTEIKFWLVMFMYLIKKLNKHLHYMGLVTEYWQSPASFTISKFLSKFVKIASVLYFKQYFQTNSVTSPKCLKINFFLVASSISNRA